MTCASFTDLGQACCAKGVDYLKLAGGGPFYMVLRLPCLPITNRRGEEVRPCAKYQEPGADPATTKESP